VRLIRGRLPPGCFVQYHEAAVGLRKDLQQAVEEPRQDLVERERRADGMVEPEHRAELRLRVLAESLAGGGPGKGDLRDDQGPGSGGIILVEVVVGEHGRRRFGRGGRLGAEREPMAADGKLVAVLESPRPRQRHAVEQRAVAAVEVLDRRGLRGQRDGTVLPADRGRVEDDVAVGMAADQGPPGGDRHPLAAAVTGLELEKGHVGPPCAGGGSGPPERPGVTNRNCRHPGRRVRSKGRSTPLGNGVTVARLALDQLV
jgi:hypothetical protein